VTQDRINGIERASKTSLTSRIMKARLGLLSATMTLAFFFVVCTANLADDPSNAIFKIGSPLVINCAIEKPESVVWTKNNSTEVVLKENLVTVTVENAVSVLRFEKPKIDEIGTYTCTSGEKSLTFTSYSEFGYAFVFLNDSPWKLLMVP